MSNGGRYLKQATSLTMALSVIALSSIGGADSTVEKKVLNIANQELFFAPVPKAVCGPGDNPETALQGQVPASLRAAGFQGFNCNLQLIGQLKGEGANWQTTEWREGFGPIKLVCAYHGTAAPTFASVPPTTRTNFGVRVIDMSDPTNPTNTAYLTTSAMLDPWESLKVNERRKLLGAVNGQNGGGGPEIDIYDTSVDCRFPQLLASTPIVPTDAHAIIGHEGNWAPDGLTYYGADLRWHPAGAVSTGQYYAIDTMDTTSPKYIASWMTNVPGGNIHGLSVRDNGNRGYFVSIGGLGASPSDLTNPNVAANNGLLIYDLSQIQARMANPQVNLISSLFWKDGSVSQHTIHVTIGKKPYIVFVDEGGSGGAQSDQQRAIACAAGMIPYPLARIIDISDETNPMIVSKLMLEVHDPANCDKTLPDVTGLLSFTYGSHYCSVDNIHKATTLACGYFNSGIRVFDIRDPYHPYEIAYYNPAGTTTPSPGSDHNRAGGWVAGGPDWCNAQVHMDASQGTLWTTCQDNGLLSLQFTHNAWPFADSSTPPGMQN